MTTLICAKCLHINPDTALEAVTIANGNAFCATHYFRYKDRVNPSAGEVALTMLDYEGFKRE